MNALSLVGDRHGKTFRRWSIVRILSRARSAIGRTSKRTAEAQRISRAYDEFVGTSDPRLEDIGISRADISAVATATFHIPIPFVIPLHAAGEKGRHRRDGVANPRDQESLHD